MFVNFTPDNAEAKGEEDVEIHQTAIKPKTSSDIFGRTLTCHRKMDEHEKQQVKSKPKRKKSKSKSQTSGKIQRISSNSKLKLPLSK